MAGVRFKDSVIYGDSSFVNPSAGSSNVSSSQTFAQSQISHSRSHSSGPFDDDSYIDSDDGTSVAFSDRLRPNTVGMRTMTRRNKTVKLSPTGNFSIKHRVPEELLTNAMFSRGEEFETMRYTAATCDPNDYVANGYNLRLATYGRNIEIFIVVTMYNEDHMLFSRTMFALAQNIKYLCEMNAWGWDADAWKKVAICIVADGRSKIHPNVLKVLEAMGVYQDGLAQASVDKTSVQAHIYEYTSQVAMDEKHQFWGHAEGMPPLQTIFLLKEKNKKKINSHRWFLKAFCPIVEPRVVVLIDVGTKPEKKALYHLWHAFFRNEQIAGACGEIRADLGTGINYCKSVLNPLVASQNFEYKISNLLDKALESVFGYITVLPGAFSAYRYKALLDYGPGVGPMAKYFQGESQSTKANDSSIFSANLYLAEDRILCFELVAKPNSRWTLHYVKDAYADTDVPDSIPEFLSQRRRWLNGSLFAGFYAIANIGRMMTSGHSALRKFVFILQFLYNCFNQLFNWFVVGNFAVTFFFLFQELETLLTGGASSDSSVQNKIINVIIEIANYSYPVSLIVIFVISFGNRPQAFANVYRAVVAGFSLIGAVMIFLILRRTFTLAQTKLLGMDQAYANILSPYMRVNETVPIQTLKMNVPGAPEIPDQGQILVQQMISRMAEVLDAQLQINVVETNTMALNYIITLSATIGVFFLASFLQLDFAHMFTCFIQYMLMLPSYINVLTVYALSNLHDVSWGTKGESKAEALPKVAIVKQKDGSITADVAVVSDKEDLSKHYRDLVSELSTGLPEDDNDKAKKKVVDPQQKQEDDYKSFRTWLVLSYLASNGLIYVLATFLNRELYLYILLYSTAGLTCTKMIGVLFFLTFRLFTEKMNVGNEGRKRYRKQFGSGAYMDSKGSSNRRGTGGNENKTSFERMEEAQQHHKAGGYSPHVEHHQMQQMSSPYVQQQQLAPGTPYNPSQYQQHLGQYPEPEMSRSRFDENRVSFVSVADTMATGDHR